MEQECNNKEKNNIKINLVKKFIEIFYLNGIYTEKKFMQ